MIDSILKIIYSKYQASDTNGVFLSAYDSSGKLLISQGVLESEQSIEQTSRSLYETYIKPLTQADLILIDVVKNLTEQKEYTVVLGMSPSDYGLALKIVQAESSVAAILPNTAEIVDMAHAIYAIKQKYQISGDVILYTFQTDRFVYTRELQQ